MHEAQPAAAPELDSFKAALTRLAEAYLNDISCWSHDFSSPRPFLLDDVDKRRAYADATVDAVQKDRFPEIRVFSDRITASDMFAALCDGAIVLDGRHHYFGYTVFSDIVVAWHGQFAHADQGSLYAKCLKTTDSADLSRDYDDMLDIEGRDDPYVAREDLTATPLSMSGNAEELAQLVRDIIATSPSPSCYSDVSHILIYAATDKDRSSIFLNSFGVDPENERDRLLFSWALEHFQPYGYAYEYNDGVSNRMSGYDVMPKKLEIELDPSPPSATLRAAETMLKAQGVAAARKRLSDWLVAAGHPDLVDLA